MSERFLYKHVIVVGIDGAGSFIREAKTPFFDRLFVKNGSVTYNALASNPSISAECWGSMLLGVSPKVHGLTNTIVSNTPYPNDSRFPSVFRLIRRAMPDAELGSFCEWNPITYGIVESNIGVSHDSAYDTYLTPVISNYILDKKPEFLFVQMDSVDSAGHSNGYGTEPHLRRISEVDKLISDIYASVSAAGIADDTLFCVIADHGGTCVMTENGFRGDHGGWTDAEKYVTFAAFGKTVRRGETGDMNVRDLAAIVLYALGIEAPRFTEEGWTSQVPENLFIDEGIPEYRGILHETGALRRISNAPHTSEDL